MKKIWLAGPLSIFLMSAALSAPLSGASDGEWSGAISCGRIATQSSSPEPFKGALSLLIEGGTVSGERTGPNFREVFSGAVDRQNKITLQAEGVRLDNPTILWRYRARGPVDGNRIQISGTMEPWASQSVMPNAVTRLRECSFELTNSSAARAEVQKREAAAEQQRLRAEQEREAARRQQASAADARREQEAAAAQRDAPPAHAPTAPKDRSRVAVQPREAERPAGPQRQPSTAAQAATATSKESPKIDEERRNAERAKAQAAADTALAETRTAQAAVDRAAALRVAAEREAAEASAARKSEADKLAAVQRAASERAAAERVAADRVAAEKAAAEKARKPPVRAQSTLDL